MGEANEFDGPKPVIINLDKDQNTRALDEGEIIHPREFELVIELIKNSLEKINSSGNDKTKNEGCNDHKRRTEFARYHDTITISGARGTGKTTFILSILRKIENSQCPTGSANDRVLSEVEVLEVIDPTLIEEKTHILVNIISKIKYSVTKSASFRNFLSDEESCLREFRSWEESFNDLAEGLPVLDGIGKDRLTGSEWDDPEYVMNEGVRKAKSANDLERNFHRFVNESLKIINKNAFVICFDDIDTNFTKGWPVLEVLRKYLTSPRIITLLSGDFELYSTIVRKSQWKNLEIDIVDGESKETLDHYKLLVSQLENQYLLKVLRPERRVTLSSLFNNIRFRGIPYLVKQKKQTSEKVTDISIENQHLEDFYKINLFDRFAIRSTRERETVFRFVGNLPMRTQIQLLQAITTRRKETSRAVFDVFQSNWNEWNSNYTFMFDLPDSFPITLMDFLIKTHIVIPGSYLIPNNSSFSINAALFASGIYFQDLSQNMPHFIFESLLRIGLTHEMGRILANESVDKDSKAFDLYLEHCKILSEKDLRIITGFFNSFDLNQATKKSSSSVTPVGGVELFALYATSKNNKESRIDAILKAEGDLLIYILGYIPLSIVSDNRGYRSPIYSIFNLLGYLGELLRWNSSLGKSNEKDILSYLFNQPSVIAYPFRKGRSDNKKLGKDLEPGKLPEMIFPSENLEGFLKILTDWLGQKVQPPSTNFLVRVSSRSFENLEALSNSNFESLAEWMSLVVLVFLNSVLIEESLDQEDLVSEGTDSKVEKVDRKLVDRSIRQTKIISSSLHFVDNLKMTSFTPKKFELTYWFISCPLLTAFVDITSLRLSSSKPEDAKLLKLFKPNAQLIETLKKVDIRDSELGPRELNDGDLENILLFCTTNGFTYRRIANMKLETFINKVITPCFDEDVKLDEKDFKELKEKIKKSKKL